MMAESGKRARGRPSLGSRERVLEAARQLFVERDYADVSTAEIIDRAGVSRGAMYHHFASKLEVYEEVWRETERRLISRLAEGVLPAATPLAALEAGCLLYLDEAATNEELSQIGLLQSRSVLGWTRWREGISDLGLQVMRAAIEAAIEAGEIKETDPDATAHLLLATLIEAALLIATAEDRGAIRPAVEPVLTSMLGGLRQ